MKRPSIPFGALQLGVGISVAGALLVYMRLLHWVPAVTEALGGLGSWPRAVALMFGVSATVLLVTTLLFGAQFPFVARSVVDSVNSNRMAVLAGDAVTRIPCMDREEDRSERGRSVVGAVG